MKKNLHPQYQQVLFVDTATGKKFVCGSTLQPKQTDKFEGKEYPVYLLPISSASHPFFTGGTQLLDVEGRVQKFNNRYRAAQEKAIATQAVAEIPEDKKKSSPKKGEKKSPEKKIVRKPSETTK